MGIVLHVVTEIMWNIKEVKEIITELRRLVQAMFGKLSTFETFENIKTKLKNHISAKNTKRNDKLGSRAGARKGIG